MDIVQQKLAFLRQNYQTKLDSFMTYVANNYKVGRLDSNFESNAISMLVEMDEMKHEIAAYEFAEQVRGGNSE